MATLKDILNTKLPEEEKKTQEQQNRQPTGPYQRNILAGLGRGFMNVLGGTADYIDAESQVSGLHGPASSTYVDVSKEELNKPGVLKAIGDYAQQKQQDWKKQGSTGKTIKDAWNNGDYEYFTSGEVLEDTGESVATMLPGIAVGLATRGQSVPTTLARAAATGTLQGFSEGGNKYRELVEKGIDPETAARAARGDAYSKALLYSAGDFLTAGANRLGVGEAASKGLGSLIGKKGVEAAEKLATKYPRLDKYGRVVGGLGLGTLGEMNETATETKLDDVWENYAKTGNIDYGALAQAYNPAYQTKESLEGAIQTIAPAAILQAAGMAVGKKMGKNNTQTETNPKPATEQAQQQTDIPESAEERATLAANLKEQNAKNNARIQELEKEFPPGIETENFTEDQFDRFVELQDLRDQVADNEAKLQAMGAEQETTTAANVEEQQSSPRTVEQINSEISDIEARQRNADADELAELAKQRQALIVERDTVERNDAIQNADAATLQKQDKTLESDYKKIVKEINTAQNNLAKLNPKKKGYQKALAAAQKKINELWAKQDAIQEQRNTIAERLAALEEANNPKPETINQPQQPMVNEQEQLRQQNEAAQNYYDQQSQQARDEQWYAMEREREEANNQTLSQSHNAVNQVDRLLAENQNVQDNLNTADANIEYDESIPAKERLQAIRQQRDNVIGLKSNAIENQRQAQEARSQAAADAVIGNKPVNQNNNDATLTSHDHFIYRAIKKLFDDSSVMTMFKSPKQYYDSNPTLPNWDTLNISQKQRASDDYVAARNNEVVVSPKTANMEELQSLANKGYLKIVRGIKRNGEQCQLVKLLKTENGENIGKTEVVAQETPPATRQSRAKGTREEQKARREARRNKPRKTYEEAATQPDVEENPAPEQVVAEEEKPVQNPNEDIRPENIFRDGDDYVDLSKLSDEELEALWRKKEKELMESINNASKYKEEHKNDADFKKKYRELLRANNRKMQDQGPILDEMNRREEAKNGSNAQSEKRNIGEKLKEKLDEANREFEETISEAKEDKKENVSRETPRENKQGNTETLQEKKKRLEKERSENLAKQKEIAAKQKDAKGDELAKLREERKKLSDRFKEASAEYDDVVKAIKEGKDNGENSKTSNSNERSKPQEDQNTKTETESKNGETQKDLDEGEAGVMRRYKTVQGYWNNHHDTLWSKLSKEQQAKAKAEFDAAQAQSKTSSTNEATTDRGVENVINEAKKAFVGCTFERDGNALLVTLPNGMQFFIDVKRKIVLSSNQEANARAAHNLNGDMKVEGNWTKLDTKGIVGFLELATNGREGTAYHEALHAAMDLVLTSKERKALNDHFKKVAESKGIDVEEAIADGYKEWVLAKQQGKGAAFGRVFQKMKDFVEKLGKVLMGDKGFRQAAKEIAIETREEIAKYKSRDIFTQIESGDVWRRGGNLTGADGETKYLVTNPDIDEHTKAYVVDITEMEKADIEKKKEIANAIQAAMKERDFKLGDSGAIVVLPPNDEKGHFVRSRNDKQVGDSTRLKAVTAIENLLSNAVYVDRHDDHSHFTDRKYVEAYVPVRNGEKVYSMRITFRDTVKGDTLKIAKVELYNIEKKKPIPQSAIKKGGYGEYVEIGDMLNGLKDTRAVEINGKAVQNNQDYMKNGKPVYSQDAQDAINQREANEKAKAETEAKAKSEAVAKARAEAEAKRQAAAEKRRRQYEFTKGKAKSKDGKASAVRNDTPEGRAAQQIHSEAKGLTTHDKLQNIFNNFYNGWVDKLDPLNRLQKQIENAAGQTLEFSKNVYKNARLARSNATTRSKMLVLGMKGATSQQVIKAINDTMNNVKLKYDVTLADVLNKLDSNVMDEAYPDYLDKGAFKNWQHAFSTYLVARRQMEIQLASPGYRGPINNRDAIAVVRNAPIEFKEAAKLYSQYNDNLLTILEDAGLISKAQHDALTKEGKNYTPMMRDFTDENGKDMLDDLFSAVGGKGVGNVRAGLKKLTKWGSERAVLDPLQTTVMNTYAVLNRAERNKVGQIFADLAKLDDKHSFISEQGRGKKAVADPDHSIFTVMENGEKVAYKIVPEYYDAVVNVNEAGADLIANMATKAATFLRNGSTIAPDFVFSNFLRDTIFASIASENGFRPIWDSVRGAYKLKTDAAFAAEFEAAGVPMTSLIGSNRRGAKETLDMMAGGKEWHAYNPVDVFKSMWSVLEDLGELAESGTRAGEYLLAKGKGKSIQEAAFAAKEITVDFSRSGKYGQRYNQITPFFNAMVQGGDRMVRLFADPRTRQTAFMNTMKYIVAPSVALWCANHDKDWYQDLPDDIKNGNWCFKLGDTIFRIPKPQEAGVLFGSGTERLLDAMMEKDAKLMKKFAIDYAKTVVPNWIPTVIGPLFEWFSGISTWTWKDVVGQRYKRLTPEKQYSVHTTEVAKLMGSLTSQSPMKIDNAIRGVFGGAGSFAAGLLDAPINAVKGKEYEAPAKDIADLPGVKRFTYQPGRRSQHTNDFYELYQRAAAYHQSYNQGKSDPVYQGLSDVNRKLTALNKEIEGIYTHKTMSPEQKKQKIREKEKLYSNLTKAAVERFKDKVK